MVHPPFKLSNLTSCPARFASPASWTVSVAPSIIMNRPSRSWREARAARTVPSSGPVGGIPPNVGVGVGVGAGVSLGGRPETQAMIAQQNRVLEALECRYRRERSSSRTPRR
jgi:hypothetical protein